MVSPEKKTYTKPQIDEIARLDRFVNDMRDANNNDGKKILTPTYMLGYIYFEKNSP